MNSPLIIFLFVIALLNELSALPVGELSAANDTTAEPPNGSIDYKLVEKPHHLFIGRCGPNDRILHQENIIVNNDGKSHVAAGIRINVEAKVYITCVKIYDELPNGTGGYPSFVAGGVGYNYIEFKVTTKYGKGFHFFVQLYGDF